MLEKSLIVLGLKENYTYEELEEAYNKKILVFGKTRLLENTYNILKQNLDDKIVLEIVKKIKSTHALINADDILRRYEEDEVIEENKKRNYNRLLRLNGENPFYVDIDNYLRILRKRLHNEDLDWDGNVDSIIDFWSDYSMYIDSKSVRNKGKR